MTLEGFGKRMAPNDTNNIAINTRDIEALSLGFEEKKMNEYYVRIIVQLLG